MGASPTPMAFGEVYTSLQTGVIDGYEHDASTTLQQRFYEVAGFLTHTRHIAGVLGLWSSTTTMAQLPADLRAVLGSGGARGLGGAARARTGRGRGGDGDAAPARHDDPRHRRHGVASARPKRCGNAKRARSAPPTGSRPSSA